MIVARVVGAEKHRFGVCTQDPIGIEDIIAEPGHCKKKTPCGEADVETDRRAAGLKRSSGERHEHSRLMARAMEFCFLVGSGAMLAGVAFSLVQESIAAPMAQVSAALAPQ